MTLSRVDFPDPLGPEEAELPSPHQRVTPSSARTDPNRFVTFCRATAIPPPHRNSRCVDRVTRTAPSGTVSATS